MKAFTVSFVLGKNVRPRRKSLNIFVRTNYVDVEENLIYQQWDGICSVPRGWFIRSSECYKSLCRKPLLQVVQININLTDYNHVTFYCIFGRSWPEKKFQCKSGKVLSLSVQSLKTIALKQVQSYWFGDRHISSMLMCGPTANTGSGPNGSVDALPSWVVIHLIFFLSLCQGVYVSWKRLCVDSLLCLSTHSSTIKDLIS